MKRQSLMDHIQSMKIRNKIIAFYLSLVLISIFLSAFLYLQISGRYLDQTIYDLSVSEVQNHNRSLELLMEDISAYSKEIISNPSIQTALDPNQVEIYSLKKVDEALAASMMFDQKISSVYIFELEGKKYYRDKQVYKNLQLEDLMAKDWYQELEALKGGYLYNFNGDGLIEDSDYDYLSFFRIINSNVNHQPVGVLMINIEDRTIMDVLNIEDTASRKVIIRDLTYGSEMVLEDRTVVGEDGGYVDEFEAVFTQLQEEDLVYKEIRIDRQDLNLTGVTNKEEGWMLAEIKPGRDRTSMIASFNLAMIVIIAINGAVIVYGSFLLARYITNPITALTKSMKAVEAGTLTPVEEDNYQDELGDLNDGYNYMIGQIQRLIEEVIKEQETIKNAELRVIMEQIKPHFMYNTLDSISSLMMLGRQEDANRALTALAKFYRSSLSDGRSVVTLATEIEIIKNYLLIQDIRYRDLFEVTYEIDESVLEVKVPKLMLQPLVENSLYHGIRPLGMDGEINVSAKRQDGRIVIEVEDNGMGMEDKVIEKVFREAEDPEGNLSSIGLPATIKRIRHMYGDACKVTIDNTYETVIRIELTEDKGGDLV